MSNGPVLFARYAYPPNVLGYCGPDAADELLERAGAGVDSPELRRLARGFEGAWPYLELIAHADGLADPLASEVVEAYWIGNRLLNAVGPGLLRGSVEARFKPRLGVADWAGMDAACAAGGHPHHGFHVFFVYPWGRAVTRRPGGRAAAGARPLPVPLGPGRRGRRAGRGRRIGPGALAPAGLGRLQARPRRGAGRGCPVPGATGADGVPTEGRRGPESRGTASWGLVLAALGLGVRPPGRAPAPGPATHQAGAAGGGQRAGAARPGVRPGANAQASSDATRATCRVR